MEIPIKKRNQYWNQRFEKGLIYGLEPAPFVNLINNHIKNSNELLILGGGYGRNAYYFAKQGYKVLNTDASKNAIQLGQKSFKNNNLHFKKMDTTEYNNLGEKSFDAIIAIYFFNLFRTNEITGFLPAVMKNLKPNGKFCANFLNKKDGEYGNGENIGEDLFLWDDYQIIQYSTKNSIFDLCKSVNIKIDTIKEVEEIRNIKGKDLTSKSYLVLGTKNSMG